MNTEITKKSLPKIAELYSNIEFAAKQNDLNILLNSEPKNAWIKNHPTASGVRYIPIQIIEFLLTSIFLKWRVEVKEVKVIANSVQVTVRLHVQDPLTFDWDWQDGIGAAPIHTKKGAGATDFTQVLTDGVMKSAPAAESYAIKDAAEKFGRLFGKDLNRTEMLPYTSLDGKIDLSKIDADQIQISELYSLLKTASLIPDEKDKIADILSAGISVEHYQSLKLELIDINHRAIDRLRNGETLNEKEIKAAIKQQYDKETT